MKTIFLVLSLGIMAAAQTASKNLALVNGEAITEDDVARVAGGRLRQLEQMPRQPDVDYERERLAIRWKALNYLIERKLVHAEAQQLMMTDDELLEIEIDHNMPVLPNTVVEKFLDANQVRMPLTRRLSRREALSQVRAYLTEQMALSMLNAYVDRLSKRYSVTTYLDPLRTEIVTTGHPTKGNTLAPVKIVEFSDFECPYCGALTPTLAAIQKLYGEKIRIVYRQFPLLHLHNYAQKAAEASLCAHDQERFWDFHDSLFTNQRQLSPDALKTRAADLKLDTAAFNICLDSGRKADGVAKDIDEGYKAGVTGTPTIFINGRMLFGNRELAEIRKVIDDELRRTGQ